MFNYARKKLWSFVLPKGTKRQDKKERFIYLRVTVDGASKEFSTKREWPVDRWDQSVGKAMGTKQDARELNEFLDILRFKVQQARKMFLEQEINITSDAIINYIVFGAEKKKSLFDVVDGYNKDIASLVGTQDTPEVYNGQEPPV